METYAVQTVERPIYATVTVPGSKSVTNRALLMAALSDGTTVLNGVLFSDDSRHFLSSLKSLGFDVEIDEESCKVSVTGMSGKIPFKSGTINVGSAGTAARFLTAMLALSDGSYVIDASEQMKKRPMKDLLDSLTELGAQFEYLENEGFLPLKVTGRYFEKSNKVASEGNKETDAKRAIVHVDISKSTQFLSALMMTACMIDEGLDIIITSEKTTGSYVKITSAMMKDFGCVVSYDGHDYHVEGGQSYTSGEFDVEPDISAACYFWAIAALTGGEVTVNKVRRNMMQGDMKFLEVLSNMGCTVEENEKGVTVTGVAGDGGLGVLKAIDINMNDFSDQTMTLAAIAPFAVGTTHIRNIGHIRLQESDRIAAILENLTTLGVNAKVETTVIDGKETEGIFIEGRTDDASKANIHGGNIQTHDDHRMAMSFAVTGLCCDGVIIEDPMCCRKTFENYFDVFSRLQN